MGIETLAISSLVGSVVSAGVGFMGAQQQAAAQSDAARYQAQVARNNQTIAQQNATYTAQAGAAQAQAQDLKERATFGALAAGQGASGLDLDSPSSTAVRRSAANVGRLDTANVYSNALLKAQGYSAQGMNFGAQAGLEDMTARNATAAGTIKGFSSLIGGATSFADKWANYSLKGVPGF